MTSTKSYLETYLAIVCGVIIFALWTLIVSGYFDTTTGQDSYYHGYAEGLKQGKSLPKCFETERQFGEGYKYVNYYCFDVVDGELKQSFRTEMDLNVKANQEEFYLIYDDFEDEELRKPEWTSQEETWAIKIPIPPFLNTNFFCEFNKITEWDSNKIFISGNLKDNCSAYLEFYQDINGVVWNCRQSIESDGQYWKVCGIVNYNSKIVSHHKEDVKESEI